MEQKQRTRMLVEAGLSIAIAYVLHFVVLFQMPQGGSVNAANLVPLIIFALRWGGKWGLITCMAYGLIEFLLGFKFSLHFLSILLDYIWGMVLLVWLAFSVIVVVVLLGAYWLDAPCGGFVLSFQGRLYLPPMHQRVKIHGYIR